MKLHGGERWWNGKRVAKQSWQQRESVIWIRDEGGYWFATMENNFCTHLYTSNVLSYCCTLSTTSNFRPRSFFHIYSHSSFHCLFFTACKFFHYCFNLNENLIVILQSEEGRSIGVTNKIKNRCLVVLVKSVIAKIINYRKLMEKYLYIYCRK